MPVQRCSKDGKAGWKYGKEGTCYTGPGAKEKAIKQGQAIEINKHKNKAEETENGNVQKSG